MNTRRRKQMESDAVEARRRDTGREPTAEQEQGKKVRFIEEERRAQEAREWQEQFMEKRKEEPENTEAKEELKAKEHSMLGTW